MKPIVTSTIAWLSLGLAPAIFAGASLERTTSPAVQPPAADRTLRIVRTAAAAPEATPEANTKTLRRLDQPDVELETVPFLGVETAPVSATLVAQLNLPNKAGLVVRRVVPGSGAAGVLQEHDILLKFDDQILIEPNQLSVLIRGRKAGDQVTLTYLRGGQQQTAEIKLSSRDVPKKKDVLRLHGLNAPATKWTFPLATAPIAPDREDAERMLSLLGEAHPGDDIRMRIERRDDAVRATRINPDNSNLVYSDEDGSLELTIKAGARSLVVRNAKGEPVFSGPVSTNEERKALPAGIRERLQKLETMQDVTFRAGRDFEGARTILGPAADPISLRADARRSRTPVPVF